VIIAAVRASERYSLPGAPALIANLVMRRYRKDIPEFWSRQSATGHATAQARAELRVA